MTTASDTVSRLLSIPRSSATAVAIDVDDRLVCRICCASPAVPVVTIVTVAVVETVVLPETAKLLLPRLCSSVLAIAAESRDALADGAIVMMYVTENPVLSLRLRETTDVITCALQSGIPSHSFCRACSV